MPAFSVTKSSPARSRLAAALAFSLFSSLAPIGVSAAPADPLAVKSKFHVEEASIADIQKAILHRQVTAVEIVKLYLGRIKAYNGPSVEYPKGLLGPIVPMAHAKGIDALTTLNLRPANRIALGFDDRKARSMTDPADNDPAMPDALEVAAEEDRQFAKTGKLVGPLHGVVIVIKDQYDTFDMRTTSGADAAYANDRPPLDATFAKKLRAAGAIILAKGNMGEYAGGYGHNRSSFGGQVADPYDTERDPGGSSSGVGAAVAANLATCGIAEETGPSIRSPAQNNNAVGLSPTQELVSRTGLMNQGINTRVGPITKTVEDAARILTVIAGYDPTDEMTAFNIGRGPGQPYESFAHGRSLKGVRLGVAREYMDRSAVTKASYENIAMAERAIEDLRKLGATIVDPGPEGLLTPYVRRYYPLLANETFAKAHPEQFPTDHQGKPTSDEIATLVAMIMDPSKVPGKPSVRDFPQIASATGETRFNYELYLAKRGDANLRTFADLIDKAQYYNDGTPGSGVPSGNKTAAKAMTYDTALRMQRRFAIQQIVLQCMAELSLDAIVYPTGTLPPAKIAPPQLDRGNNNPAEATSWNFLGTQGFPAITVPGGFTTQVYDREVDPTAPPLPPARSDAESDPRRPRVPTRLGPAVPAAVPIGFDFLGRPFSEPELIMIASAYEAATHHRRQPADFGPLKSP